MVLKIKTIKSLFGEVVKMVDVEMVKRAVKNYQIKLVLNINSHSYPAVIIIQQQLQVMAWF